MPLKKKTKEKKDELRLTLSIWANIPSWLLCRVVSLTKSLACEAIFSNKEDCEDCRPGLLELEPELPVRAKILVTLGCLTGVIGGFKIQEKKEVNRSLMLYSFYINITGIFFSETCFVSCVL